MRRRDVLRFGGPAVVSVLGGCLTGTADEGSESAFEDLSPSWSLPESVYYQGHRKGMKMIGTRQQGTLTVALSYTYAERFWTVTGTETQRVGVDDGYNAVHLMASVWHTETGVVLPVGSGLRVRVERDGESVTERALWPMLAQRMGFHFGDNIEFPAQDEYALVVDTGTPSAEGIGSFEGAFRTTGTVRFEFDFRRTRRNEIAVSDVLDRRGERDALSPMEMEMLPLSVAPASDELPGRTVGEKTSGDAVFVVTTTDVAGETYVTVSPRTPYNRYLLPLMALSLTVERDGTAVFSGPLSAAIGPDRRYHYGTVVEHVESGDELTIRVDSPPQAARHAGYETAFLEMPEMTVSV